MPRQTILIVVLVGFSLFAALLIVTLKDNVLVQSLLVKDASKISTSYNTNIVKDTKDNNTDTQHLKIYTDYAS